MISTIMNKISRFFYYLFHKPLILVDLFLNIVSPILPDKFLLKVKYRIYMGYWMDFSKPHSFCEKLQWLKLYNRRPEYTQMVDKFAVKEYVASKIGGEYIIPTLGVWNSPEEIEWDKLPNEFVLKTTHGGGGGGVVICKNKDKLDKKQAKAILQRSMNVDIYRILGEWPYKNVPKRIIAEKFISSTKVNAPKDIPDFKFFCFEGEPIYCQVTRDRSSLETIDFYDMEWKHQEFVGLNPNVGTGSIPVVRPSNFDDMKQICRDLAVGIPFVRVDLYEVDDNVYFGELTFYPTSGLGVSSPSEWNIKIGEMLKLPTELWGRVKIKVVDHTIEREIDSSLEDLKDYKFFCFNGEVKYVKVDFGRFIEHHANYYDMDWNLQPFGEVICPPIFEHKEDRPENFEVMVELAMKLSEGIPFLRVDFYNIRGVIYFGELTFFPGSGLVQFSPSDWDYTLGDLLKLSHCVS